MSCMRAIEARTIGLRGRVNVTGQATLMSTLCDPDVNERIGTNRLLVDVARTTEANGARFRGADLTQLVVEEKSIVLNAAGVISRAAGSGTFGYQSTGIQADGGNIQNGDRCTGADITLSVQNGGGYSTAGIYARGIYVRGVEDEARCGRSSY